MTLAQLAMGLTAETLRRTGFNTPAALTPALTRSPSRIRTDIEGTAGTHPNVPRASPFESPVFPKKKPPIAPIPKAIKNKYGAHVLKQGFDDFEAAQKGCAPYNAYLGLHLATS
jgi:hypothetical protein